MRILILGGGPGGYEAALVAAELGAEVTLIDKAGLGGACVLYDCVPSKALCTAAEAVTWQELGETLGVGAEPAKAADFRSLFRHIVSLAEAQSRDVERRIGDAGVKIVHATGRFVDAHTIEAGGQRFGGDAILVATGSSPRELDTAKPDGERILNGRQIYSMTEVPEHLIVVGSGATGVEFAHAFNRLGTRVTLVSSRDHVLPNEDTDAAHVLEAVFKKRGMTIMKRTRAAGATVQGNGVVVALSDGTALEGSHALFTVGQVPNTAGLGLENAGVLVSETGGIPIDGVSRTSASHVYAAGDVVGGMMLASVAAMQGRIAMWHALGQAVAPIRADAISSTVFTDPEIATVGVSEPQAKERNLVVDVMKLPLATNARSKMMRFEDGFVKLLATPGGGTIVGGTVVAPHASDLILPISLAVHARIGVAQLAQAFSIYPSLSGSIQEAARRLMGR
ncbi:MAG: NAD(P)H-quinone dehydrogenase [Actinomycetota bacterium]|nr:NAD(P)H-quinone dehydrogenase [Actinomycetota bacterium]